MIDPIRYLTNLFRINEMEHLSDTDIFKEFISTKGMEREIEDLLQSESLSDEDQADLFEASMEMAKLSYYTYFKMTFTANNPLVLGKHIELICDVLTLAEMGLFKDRDTKSRIAISVPPRHLKSTSITNSFPAWFMGKEPWRSTIVTSYGDNLVQKAGQKNREKIQELSSLLFGAKIKKDVGKKAEWELIGNGRFKGATIRGGATGEGCELLVIDDPIKNREEANSKNTQQKVWDEYTDTYLTRVHQNGIIVNIMTRWHNSDLRGKIDEHEKSLKWLKVDLSAMCETEEECNQDPFDREIGEALYPQMYNELYFEPFKMNPRTWWSLYKQKPMTDSGEYFNRGYFQYFEYDSNFVTLWTERGKLQYLVKDCWLFQTVDTAQKDKQENDETALITWVVTPDNDMLMIDVFHDRIQVPDQEKAITQCWNKWEVNFQAIEDKQSGTGLIQKFKREGRPILELKAIGDKIERSTTAQIFYANMKVYHLKGAEWLGYVENQMLEFPSGKHDDVLDCISYGAKVVADKSGIVSFL